MYELLLDQHLAQAEAHIVFGEGLIAQQMELLDRLATAGLDTIQAQRLLDQFEGLQLEHIAHREWLLKKLAENPCGSPVG